MKKLFLAASILGLLVLASCGSSKDTDSDQDEKITKEDSIKIEEDRTQTIDNANAILQDTASKKNK